MRTWLWQATLLILISLLVGLTLGLGLPSRSAAASPSLTLTPGSGPPGTVVTLHGYLPGETTPPPSFMGVNICLDGCATGFTETDVPFRWLGGGHFTAEFTVPSVPVLTAKGPLVLRDGRYRIGFTCFGPGTPGCAYRSEATATFTVRGAHPRSCSGDTPCAVLRLNPAQAEPGQVVRVRGFAPLSPVIGQPFGYALVLRAGETSAVLAQMGQLHQSMTGEISGSFRLPAILPGLGVVTPGEDEVRLQFQFNQAAGKIGRLPPGVSIVKKGKVTPERTSAYELVNLAPTPFRVLPLPSWTSLGRLSPKASEWSMALPLTARPGTTRDFAYCVPGGIRLTTDGGKTWTSIATEAAAVASMSGPFPIAYNLKTPMPDVTCTSLLWDPNDSHTFYASFNAINRRYASAPPLYSVLYETEDGGRTWHPVPVPKGYRAGDFGGIEVVHWRRGYAVEAVFGHTGEASPGFDGLGTLAATAEVTADGGKTWQTTGLTCPLAAPCLRFGAMPGMLPGMGAADLQPLVVSADGGKTWRAIAWPKGNVLAQGFPGQSELVWLGGKEVAFLDPSSQYPLRISRDGGHTWRAVALPLPSGTAKSLPVMAGSSPYVALMLLPDGQLLAATAGTSGFGARWWLLPPRASGWTADTALTAPAVLGRLLVVGSRLYWLRVSSGGPQGIYFTGLGSAPLPGRHPPRHRSATQPQLTGFAIGGLRRSRQVVTIWGQGFGERAGTVSFLPANGRVERLTVRSWQDTEVLAVIPLGKEALLHAMSTGARLLLRTTTGLGLIVPLRGPRRSTPPPWRTVIERITPDVAVRLRVPATWRGYHIFVGDTGGTAWVNPSDPAEHLDVVSTGCLGCMEDSHGAFDVKTLLPSPTVHWTGVTGHGTAGTFLDTSHLDPYTRNGDPRNPAHDHLYDPYVAAGFVRIVPQPMALAVLVEAFSPVDLRQALLAGVRIAVAGLASRQARRRLPDGFDTYAALRTALLPRLADGTRPPVLLPRTLGARGEAPSGTVIDASYRVSATGYRLELYYGRPLPLNSPEVAEGGNAAFLLAVRGSTSRKGLELAAFGPLSAALPGARTTRVPIGHGITLTLHQKGEGDGATYSASWQEDRFTFVIAPTVGTGNPLATAKRLAATFRGLHLPGEDGTAVFTFGPDAPSIAVFRLGKGWYSVYANGWQAASFAAAMTK